MVLFLHSRQYHIYMQIGHKKTVDSIEESVGATKAGQSSVVDMGVKLGDGRVGAMAFESNGVWRRWMVA